MTLFRMPDMRTLLIVLAIALAPACAIDRSAACKPGEQTAVGDSLYFGMTRPDGVITADEWQDFIASEVTPRFPHGLTSWQASGQWLSKDGALQREPSRVVYVVHPDDPRSEKAIHEIIESYRRQFQQEAVLRVRTTVCVSL